MVELARHHGDGPISLTEMADHESLPGRTWSSWSSACARRASSSSTRGAHGGYTLPAPPAEIRMGAVIRALEGPIAPMVCASEDPSHAGICERIGFCNVNLLWVRCATRSPAPSTR